MHLRGSAWLTVAALSLAPTPTRSASPEPHVILAGCPNLDARQIEQLLALEQLLRQLVCLLVALFVSSVGCSATQSLFATPTATPILPKPGEWTVSAESLGEFVFEVAPDSTVVTLVSFHFRQFQCGSTIANERWLHGDWSPDTNNTATITDREFTVGPHVSGPYALTFGGSRPSFSFFAL